MIFSSTLSPPGHLPPPRPKPRARRKPEQNSLNSIPPCTECGKLFLSWKALFGHMRCHPERQWRGIKLPPHSRRSHFTEEEFQVATILLLLANGPAFGSDPFSPGFLFNGSIWRPRRFNKGDGRGRKKRARENIGDEQHGFQLFDLNLPPPVESGEEDCGLVLDLKLGA